MNQGTYNSAVRTNSGLSSNTPTTPGGGLYKTNVNRTKTKKWVEAKVQSYDGDDWGNEYDDDEDEDEDDEPPPPPASRATGLRQPGQSNQLPSHPALSSRTFSQPLSGPASAASFGTRSPSGPPTVAAVAPPPAATPPPQQLSDSPFGSNVPAAGPSVPVYGEPGRSSVAPASTETPQNQAEDLRRLSTSPQLPEMARMSGFGDDLFSSSARNRPTSPPENLTQPPSTMLGGPRLEPNPNVKMPSLEEDDSAEPQKPSYSDPAPLSQTRPQLPGTWVTESGTPRSEQEAPVYSTTSRDKSPEKAGPDTSEIEPTTKVKHLSSDTESGKTAAPAEPAQVFNNPVGEHDDHVASQVLSSGPGHHPTPHSLPPINTGSSPMAKDGAPVARSDISSQPSASTHVNTASTSSAFEPTAPLNPRRSEVHQLDQTPGEGPPRQSTISTVGTGSPVKESDKLREEIMKSLSPNPESAPPSGGLLSPTATNESDIRESRYLSGVYDEYMSPAEEKVLLETGQALKQGSMSSADQSSGAELKGAQLHEIAPLSPSKSSAAPVIQRPRRFSWEQPEVEDISESPAVVSSGPKYTDVKPTVGPEPPSSTSTPDTLHVQNDTDRVVSHQVSDISMKPGASGELTILDPPSPVSDQNPPAGMTEDKVLHEMSPKLGTSGADPSENTTPVIPGEVQQHDIMGFRDILGTASTDQRISKMEEARMQFSTMDWGLEGWILHMKEAQDLELSGGVSGETSGTGQASSQQPATQQPYYQQYLNASNPNVSLGRSASGSLQGTSGFNSGNQVGVKSKELLHAAGAFGNKGMKSGMKLFNRGKSKLRERGDKVFS